jgi:hypothetical protein
MQTRTRLFLALCASVAAASAMAQAPAPGAAPGAPPPAPPRARGPALALAVEAAQTAIATCLTNGYKTTATVVDSAGVPVAMLAADGAAERTQMIGLTKTAATIKYKVPSGEIADRVKTDAALAAEVKADPKIGTAAPRAAHQGGEARSSVRYPYRARPAATRTRLHAGGLDKIASRLK